MHQADQFHLSSFHFVIVSPYPLLLEIANHLNLQRFSVLYRLLDDVSNSLIKLSIKINKNERLFFVN
jgi:hypothetical protein